MVIYFASDHAGFELKNELIEFVRSELGHVPEDCGAYTYDKDDDYVDFVQKAAQAVSDDPLNNRAIILGGSGQGEAMAANKFKGVRAAVYYGEPKNKQIDADGTELDMITSVRVHNDANVLSLGARFLGVAEVKTVVASWLRTEFGGEPRHVRRIKKIG